MYDIFNMTVENTTKEAFSDERLYEAIYSEVNPIAQAKYVNHLRRVAKALGMKEDFETMNRAFLKLIRDMGDFEEADNTTHFGGDYPELRCGKWIADKNGVREINKNGDEKFASYEPITIVKKTKCIQNGNELVTLAYKNGNTWHEKTVSRDIICISRKLQDLGLQGFPVTSSNATQLVGYLADIEHLNKDRIPVEKSTAKMGWNGNDFLPYSDRYAFGAEDSGLKKLYDSISQTGCETDWLNHVKSLRAGNRSEIQVMLSASFASVLVERLNALPFFVNLYGESGNGKSVAMKLATSVWADPSDNRFIGDFESTDVALEAKADFLNNLPMMLDDTSKVSYQFSRRFETVVYELASGKGRSRSNLFIGLDRERSWSNCTLTTGERPLSSLCKQGGAEARTLELECGKNLFADPLKTIEIIEDNYGFAGRRFVEIVKDMDKSELRSIYREAEQEIREAVPGIMGKQLASMAVLLTADRIATEQIFRDGKYISMETVKSMAKTEEQVSDYEKIYNDLVDYIRMNKGKFDGTGSGEQYGFAKDSEMTYFYDLGFRKACEALGYRKPKDFIAWGIRQGLIIADTNRQNKNIKLPKEVAERYAEDNGKAVKQVRCICFKMERPVAEENTSATAEIEVVEKTQTSPVNRMLERSMVFTSLGDLEQLDIPA